jgi:lipoate-protein ligase A
MSNNHSHIWRLIDNGPSNGLQNMAIDEALLASFAPQSSMPVLRLYGWDPPALSIGRFQKPLMEVDIECCGRDGVPIVRRITGGGALYHADELTYSIVCSSDQIPYATSVKDSFRILTGFLIDFYCRLGLNASYAVDSVSETERLGERTSFCFAGKESFDILIDGKKIGGNAQRRLKNVIFQHGSIPVLNRTAAGLRYMKVRPSGDADTATSLSECGVCTDWETMKRKLAESFCRQLGVLTQESSLSLGEHSLATSLLTEKYSTEEWNLQGDVR